MDAPRGLLSLLFNNPGAFGWAFKARRALLQGRTRAAGTSPSPPARHSPNTHGANRGGLGLGWPLCCWPCWELAPNGAGTPLPGRTRVWKPRGGPKAARHGVLWHGVLWHGVLRPGAGGDRAGVGWVSCIFPALQPCKFAKHEARALFPWLLPAPWLLVRSLE